MSLVYGYGPLPSALSCNSSALSLASHLAEGITTDNAYLPLYRNQLKLPKPAYQP